MKKILSLGVAAAVLSLTAVAASAAIAPTDNGVDPVAGELYAVDVVATEFEEVATQFTVVASDNLVLADYATISTGLAAFNDENLHFAWAGSEAPAEGSVLLTLYFEVVADADEEVSVSLVPDEGFEAAVDATELTAVVVEGTPDEPDLPTDEPDEPIDEPASDDGGIAVETPDAGDEEDTENANTGIALAVVPAIVAGAAVVVAKKRK